jgi:hypothetical protein
MQNDDRPPPDGRSKAWSRPQSRNERGRQLRRPYFARLTASACVRFRIYRAKMMPNERQTDLELHAYNWITVPRNDLGHNVLPSERLKPIRDCSMTALPVDRALRIYDTLANRSETKGAREGLSKHLMEKYIAGEKDQHRLTVEGLSYLRSMYRVLDSQN